MARYVIGDIHGCSAELGRLIDDLRLGACDTIVFLGDYVDRGPDSHGVVSRLLALQQHCAGQVVFLKGNHEDMLLSFLGFSGHHGDMFLINGGTATLASYGLDSRQFAPVTARSAIPPDHLEFFQNLKTHFLLDSFLCVHAGVHPEKSLVEQTEEELFWIRNTFIYRPHALPYTVLFGHTPQPAVFFNLPYKVGLDTGLVYGNMLTCLEVDEKVLIQIGRGKKRVHRSSAERQWRSFPAVTA